jgi:succinate dehydrogenase/fumarate reductase-like Fe-S protein
MPVTVELRIKRFDPERDRRPHWESYSLEVEETDRVLDALHEVRWHHDGTLAFRRSCAHGVCGSDAMVINGHNRLACVLLVKDVGHVITVEPLRGLRVLKDLVVDMEPFFDQYRSVQPWLQAPPPEGDRERLQSPEDRARYDDTTKCILCSGCHHQRPPLHLRLPRPAGARAAGDPGRAPGRLGMPDGVQLHRRLSSRDQGHPGHRGGQKGHAAWCEKKGIRPRGRTRTLREGAGGSCSWDARDAA